MVVIRLDVDKCGRIASLHNQISFDALDTSWTSKLMPRSSKYEDLGCCGIGLDDSTRSSTFAVMVDNLMHDLLGPDRLHKASSARIESKVWKGLLDSWRSRLTSFTA